MAMTDTDTSPAALDAAVYGDVPDDHLVERVVMARFGEKAPALCGEPGPWDPYDGNGQAPMCSACIEVAQREGVVWRR